MLRPLILGLLLGLSACNSDNDSDDGNTDNTAGDGDSVFAASPIAQERFGSVRQRQSDPDVDAALSETVVRGFNDFALEVHRRLGINSPQDNIVSSGYSIATALSLLRAGAAEDVDSSFANLTQVASLAESDLHDVMNAIAIDLETRSNDDVLLRTANRLFTHPDRSLSEAFLNTAVGQYGAPATEIDFREDNAEALALINEWVSIRTDSLIPALLSEIPPETQVMIVNAILLDALWAQPFQNRGERPFTRLDDSISDVSTFGDIRTLPAFQDDSLTAVEIPYAGDSIAMLVMQPDSLDTFESTFDDEQFQAVRASLEPVTVDLTVPAWSAESRFAPTELLAPAGFPANPLPLDDLFDDDPIGELYDLSTVHQAIIDVDENGTRAAAATAIGVGATSIPVVDLTISIDRPFAYVLFDRTTGLVLFAGRTIAP